MVLVTSRGRPLCLVKVSGPKTSVSAVNPLIAATTKGNASRTGRTRPARSNQNRISTFPAFTKRDRPLQCRGSPPQSAARQASFLRGGGVENMPRARRSQHLSCNFSYNFWQTDVRVTLTDWKRAWARATRARRLRVHRLRTPWSVLRSSRVRRSARQFTDQLRQRSERLISARSCPVAEAD